MELKFPSTLREVTWCGIGILFGRAFGKHLDLDVQSTVWFKRKKIWQQRVIRFLLDLTHHWWIGLLLMCYAPNIEVFWFGMGLFLNDLPDVPRRLQFIFSSLKTKVKKLRK